MLFFTNDETEGDQETKVHMEKRRVGLDSTEQLAEHSEFSRTRRVRREKRAKIIMIMMIYRKCMKIVRVSVTLD